MQYVNYKKKIEMDIFYRYGLLFLLGKYIYIYMMLHSNFLLISVHQFNPLLKHQLKLNGYLVSVKHQIE